MRLLPILTAATIGLFATAAVAQSTNTTDPNSAPGASATGGKPSGAVNRANTMDPNSAPGASTTGGKRETTGQLNQMDTAKTANTTDPNSTPATAAKKKAKKPAKKMKKEM